MAEQLDPSRIMQIGSGFWASKVLLSAVELELFTELLGVHARSNIGPPAGSSANDNADRL